MKLLEIFQREDDCMSLTRIIIFAIAIEFLAITPFLCFTGQDSPAYLVLSTVMVIMIFAGIYKYNLESKFLNIKVVSDNEQNIHQSGTRTER